MPLNLLNEPQLPFPIQTYLWRQLRPFIRPKLGRVHEASCVFCQHAPGHHEMKEACTSLEKVLVQNIHTDLSPNLRNILSSVPRWRVIQASLPYILQATASLLHTKKDFQNLGPQETTLLYILHWIILDAAEECSSDQVGVSNNPFDYLFSVPTITLFVHLFVPLCNHMKDIDFKDNLRLENGQKIWYPIYECRHPEAPCFTAHCRPKPRSLWKTTIQSSRAHNISDDVFLGTNGSPPSHTGSNIFPDQGVPLTTRAYDDDGSWVSSPKDKAFPETIPEESSSTEDEHVVIFTIPSLDKPDKMPEGVREVSTIYAGEASIFHVAMGEIGTSTKQTLTIEQVTSASDVDVTRHYESKSAAQKSNDAMRDPDEKYRPEKDAKADVTRSRKGGQKCPSSGDGQTHQSVVDIDVRAATFLDVAVMKCLFLSHWQEEGFFWSLQFLYNRLRRINEESSAQQTPRRRSNSLPIPKIEVSLYQSPESTRKGESRDVTDSPDHRSQVPPTDKAELQDGTTYHDTRVSHTRKVSERTKRRMRIADLKAFVETKLLSKSEKALEKICHESDTSLHEEEHHRSLDTGERRLTRQPSVCSRTSDDQDPDLLEHESNLVKGKSMPSLR
ncbi:hypothetical protein QAD02_007041 [Eretmocerus hayati]|uniref:Uncharacterized protein n=1 Tax=Eretmocerus hayati TaxID=131215 RepID=A0ACC2N2I8_9HYME|nr:hypothetical protein QAD02_007041 [Eretmocerus hayati]